MTDSRVTAYPKSLQRKIAWQRLAMFWERLWAALAVPLIALCLAGALIFSGLLEAVPSTLRIALLGLCAAALAASLWPFRKLSIPSRADALRRMELEQSVLHRAYSSSGDDVVSELTDDATRAIWTEHKRRLMQQAEKAAVSLPRSAWRVVDPVALRVPAAMALMSAVLLGHGTLSNALQPSAASDVQTVAAAQALDVWLKPPAYTGKPPLLLTSPAMIQKLASGGALTIPENSILNIRLAGAVNGAVALTAEGTGQADQVKILPSESAFVAEVKLTGSARLEVTDAGQPKASWRFSVVKDAPPAIKLTAAPAPEKSGSLTVPWEASDDHGVSGITAEIALADEQDGGVGFESNGPFLFDPPKFPVTLKHANAKSEKGKTTQDLTGHPWAGFNVEIILKAKDAAGHVTETKPLAFKLPEKLFVRPLARSIIEQRKALVMDPAEAQDVAELFDTLLLYPDGLLERSAHHLRLASLSARLKLADSNDAIAAIIGDMWTLAVELEDGSFADAKKELAELKKQLEEALRNGASEQEIAQLMDKMRKAMDKYLQSLAKENQKKDFAQNRNRPSREISKDDLAKMLEQIEKLSKNGAKDMAQNLLDELDRMLQNLERGENQKAGPDGEGMGEMMDQLSDLMKEQQRLMDQTQRAQGGQQPGGEGDPQMGQDGQGGMGGQGEFGEQPGDGQNGLADRQQQLRDLLDRMQKEMGGGAPGEFDEAQRQMKMAEGSLRDGENGSAMQQQSDALDALKKGAQSLSKQMRERGQGQARNRGRNGEASGTDEDPLGRPRATRNPDEGPDEDMVPSELAMRKAREILEQLRAKANAQGLTDQERSYIDRLLRGLY